MPENTAEQLPQLDNVRDNATQEDFKMKNKVYEMLLYAYPALEQFPKSDRKLADHIREAILQVFELVIHLENKHYKKTTLGELDDQLDVLRHLVRLAADQQLHPDKKPCLPIRKYEILSRKINEIGCMIGGYYKSLNGSTAGNGGAANKSNGKRQGNTCFLYYGNKPLIEDLPCLSGVRVSTTLPTVALVR